MSPRLSGSFSALWSLVQVTLIHSQVALADKELLPCVRQEAKEILLQKGVQLLLSACEAPSRLPPPWPGSRAFCVLVLGSSS